MISSWIKKDISAGTNQHKLDESASDSIQESVLFYFTVDCEYRYLPSTFLECWQLKFAAEHYPSADFSEQLSICLPRP